MKRYIHVDYIKYVKSIKNGFDISGETLYNMCENITNPLNEKYPSAYKQISESDYEVIKKEAESRGVYDEF